MQSASLVLLSQQEALQRALDIVANNVANSNTTGFKKVGIEFDTLLTNASAGKGLSFVVDRATYRDASGGPIQPTGNQLDLAIQGSGYFEVQAKDGSTHYTRNGAFQLNSQGQIVTLTGLPVLNDGGQAITVPDTVTEINVSGNGFVTARIDNGVNLSELGQIALVKFNDEQKMQSEGDGTYSTTQVSTPTDSSSGIVQGALEQSNVQTVSEMTQMMKIQRSYEEATNLISSESNRLNDAITKLSKTTI